MTDDSTSSSQGDPKDAIKQNAEGPKQASPDGMSSQQHSLDDQTRLPADKVGRTRRTTACPEHPDVCEKSIWPSLTIVLPDCYGHFESGKE